jgi:putative ABC transport system permease protein
MTRGPEADFVVTQAGALTAILGSIDQAVADDLRAMPEVAAVDGMVFANSILDDGSYLFCFGYDPSGFSIRRFRIVAGERLDQASARRGRPLLLGRQAAERLHRKVGDVLYIGQVPFRVVGLYETGSSLEDSAAVVSLEDAQTLTLQPRRVTVLHVKLRDPALADAFRARVARRFPDLTAIASEDFADQEYMVRVVDAMAMAVAGLAVVIGGVGMTNTLFMSVFERTTEIGVLRALGWRRRRVLGMILRESLLLGVLGGPLRDGDGRPAGSGGDPDAGDCPGLHAGFPAGALPAGGGGLAGGGRPGRPLPGLAGHPDASGGSAEV